MAEAQTFGKYTLMRKLAAGGMGEVYLAKQQGFEGFEKFLVIKRILSHHTDNPDYVDMFFAEARLAAKMSHSSVMPFPHLRRGALGHHRLRVRLTARAPEWAWARSTRRRHRSRECPR